MNAWRLYQRETRLSYPLRTWGAAVYAPVVAVLLLEFEELSVGAVSIYALRRRERYEGLRVLRR